MKTHEQINTLISRIENAFTAGGGAWDGKEALDELIEAFQAERDARLPGFLVFKSWFYRYIDKHGEAPRAQEIHDWFRDNMSTQTASNGEWCKEHVVLPNGSEFVLSAIADNEKLKGAILDAGRPEVSDEQLTIMADEFVTKIQGEETTEIIGVSPNAIEIYKAGYRAAKAGK